jgi:hypothetical protein
MPGIHWNQEQQCWFTQLSKEGYLNLKVFLEGKAMLELSELRHYL